LLDGGAKPELRGLFAETALHWAAFLGEIRLTARLIEGSDINLKDEKYRSSPLGWAIHACYKPPAMAVAELLFAGHLRLKLR
jgi:hypothetical protein